MKHTIVKAVIALAFMLGLVSAWWFSTPSLNAEAWQPGAAPAFTGVLSPNTDLQNAGLLGKGLVHGPEDIAFDAQGRLHAGLHDGRVIRLEGDKVITLANTGGRPLGMQFDASGNLIVCDAWKGLLQLSPDGQITTLVSEVMGVPLTFTDDLDIAADGKIYFTDASTRYRQADYILDLLEGHPYGRLYV